jgi:hypothetical protein
MRVGTERPARESGGPSAAVRRCPAARSWRVEAMTALALRHVPRGEVIQLLTGAWQARETLPGVLA